MNQIENRMIQRNSSIHVWLCLKKTKSDNHIFFFMLDSCALCWLAEAAQQPKVCRFVCRFLCSFSPGPACCWHPLRPFPSKHNQPAHWKLGVVSTWWLFQIQKGKKKKGKTVQCCYISRTPPIRKECLDGFLFVPCLRQMRPLQTRNFVKVLSWNHGIA